MAHECLIIKKSPPLMGTVSLLGAKNAVLPIMASLLLTSGKSILTNVPNSSDIRQMAHLLENLGATVVAFPEEHRLEIDTSTVSKYVVDPETMNKMRASIIVMGPLIARFGKAHVAPPGGCLIGARPIDLHLKGLEKLGVTINQEGHFLMGTRAEKIAPRDYRIILDYPSVGATENIIMCAALTPGTTTIINAAIEPEVLDVIAALQNMGAKITFGAGLSLTITGVSKLNPIEHHVIPDRLEAGSLLLAAAITGGEITITNGRSDHMDLFLDKLQDMGHTIITNHGITLKATKHPHAINFKTAPYPGFPTDLQAPTMAALTLAEGMSEIEETVFENRLIHVDALRKMGAHITVEGRKALIHGVKELQGCKVLASDIRASCALVLAGLAAQGVTTMAGINHWKRGYENLDKKLAELGADISLISTP